MRDFYYSIASDWHCSHLKYVSINVYWTHRFILSSEKRKTNGNPRLCHVQIHVNKKLSLYYLSWIVTWNGRVNKKLDQMSQRPMNDMWVGPRHYFVRIRICKSTRFLAADAFFWIEDRSRIKTRAFKNAYLKKTTVLDDTFRCNQCNS